MEKVLILGKFKGEKREGGGRGSDGKIVSLTQWT